MQRTVISLMGLALAATAAAAPATAEPASLDAWGYDRLHGGRSAEAMMDTTQVFGIGGEHVGEIKDFIVGADNAVQYAVIESGGVLDIGDQHFAYPWRDMEFDGQGGAHVTLGENRLERTDEALADLEGRAAPGDLWRLSRLIGDTVYLEGEVEYGFVDDVIIGQDGEVMAVLVYPEGRYGADGPIAWPFHGLGDAYDATADIYAVPFRLEDVINLPPFETAAGDKEENGR